MSAPRVVLEGVAVTGDGLDSVPWNLDVGGVIHRPKTGVRVASVLPQEIVAEALAVDPMRPAPVVFTRRGEVWSCFDPPSGAPSPWHSLGFVGPSGFSLRPSPQRFVAAGVRREPGGAWVYAVTEDRVLVAVDSMYGRIEEQVGGRPIPGDAPIVSVDPVAQVAVDADGRWSWRFGGWSRSAP